MPMSWGSKALGGGRGPGAESDFRCSRIHGRLVCHLKNVSGQKTDQWLPESRGLRRLDHKGAEGAMCGVIGLFLWLWVSGT